MRHDIRGEKLTALCVVPVIAIDQQLDAGILVLPDQVDGLEHGADEAAQWPPIGELVAFSRHLGIVTGKQPRIAMGLFDCVVIALRRIAVAAQHRKLMTHGRNIALDIAGVGQMGDRA